MVEVLRESNETAGTLAIVDMILFPTNAIGARHFTPPDGVRGQLRDVALAKLEAMQDKEWRKHRSAAYLLHVWARLTPEATEPKETLARLIAGGDYGAGVIVDSLLTQISGDGTTYYRFGSSVGELIALDLFKASLQRLSAEGMLSARAEDAFANLAKHGWHDGWRGRASAS